MGRGALGRLRELRKEQGALSWLLWDAVADALATVSTVSSGNLCLQRSLELKRDGLGSEWCQW